MLVNHANLGRLFTGYKATFARGETLAKPIWPAIAMQLPSGTEREAYDWLGAAEGMREWTDDRVITGLATHGFEIENKDWEQTIGVKRNKIADDKHGIYAPMFERMGEAAALHPDELIFALLNNGTTALGYDNVPFFSAAHPALKNPVPPDHPGVQSNLHSDGDGPYWYLADLSSTLKPLIYQTREKIKFVAKNSLTDDNVFFDKEFYFGVDARYNAGFGMWQQMFASDRDLTEENVEAAILAMENLLADNGKPMQFSPTHVIVPTTLKFEARRIFHPDFVPSGSNGATITNIHRGAMSVIVSKHLARA